MQKKTCYIGVDPGTNGAIAVIVNKHVIATTTMILTSKKAIDLTAMTSWIMTMTCETMPIACIEKVSAMPGQGVTSMFTFGFNTGVMHGIFAALGIPRHVVTPQTWKKIILKDTPRDKLAAIELCRRIYPDVSLLATERSKKPHSGIADAICIARYASLSL